MLWFQKDSLDIVGFRTFRGGPGFLNKIVDFGGPKCHLNSLMSQIRKFPQIFPFFSSASLEYNTKLSDREIDSYAREPFKNYLADSTPPFR